MLWLMFNAVVIITVAYFPKKPYNQPKTICFFIPEDIAHPGLSELCSCGCRGWCSVFPLLEHFRCDMSREHTDIRPAILDFKADWPALVEICGLRTWAHNLHPCPCCTVDKSSLLAVGTHSLHASPHPFFTQSSYDQLVARTFRAAKLRRQSCLLSSSINYKNNKEPKGQETVALNRTRKWLCPTTRPNGNFTACSASKNGRGRCLKAAFPLLGLRRGNRLEPSENLLDVDNFMQLTTPFNCTFYTGASTLAGRTVASSIDHLF